MSVVEISKASHIFNLYQQTDGVAMGSPLGPLLANTFLCYIEETLESQDKLPAFYRRYVDDTLVVIKDLNEAEKLLTTLNSCHPSIQFTMELAVNGTLPFLGMSLTKQGSQITTSVYRKSTNKGLFLHYQSHVDNRYKKSLLKTMLHRAHNLSSTDELFKIECDNLTSIFLKLKYPAELIKTTIDAFINTSRDQSEPHPVVAENPKDTIRIVLPFIDQKPADIVKRQLTQLNKKLNTDLQPVFVSRKIEDVMKAQTIFSQPAASRL